MIDVQFSSFEIFRDSPGESTSTCPGESEIFGLTSAEAMGVCARPTSNDRNTALALLGKFLKLLPLISATTVLEESDS